MAKKFNISRNSKFLIVALFQIVPALIIIFHMYGFTSGIGNSGWIYEEKTNCKFFTQSNCNQRSFVWNGDCKEGFADGYGELTMFQNGREFYLFEGFISMGKSNGQGKLRILSDGDVYEGNFKNNFLNGFGRFYNDDGDHYAGYYKNGLPSGHGTYWYEPESQFFKYVGEWKEGLENGRGVLYYRNGEKVSGFFSDGHIDEKSEIDNSKQEDYPKNILITNDDGVEDLDRLLCLADALSEYADMIVIATSHKNQSGTSNMMDIVKQGYLKTKCLSVDSSKNIFVYEVQGYPADCVAFGVSRFFKEQGKTVDLVISGINGGHNLGLAWFGSGTVGAARTAALLKIPAIAISGIDDDGQDGDNNLKKICLWVSEFVKSPIIDDIRPYEYLTISIPESLNDIKGVKITERAISFDHPPFYLDAEDFDYRQLGSEFTWKLKPTDPSKVYNMPAENDVFYYSQDYIVVVPMSIDENNMNSLMKYKIHESGLPGTKSD